VSTPIDVVQGVPLDIQVTVEGGAARWTGERIVASQVRNASGRLLVDLSEFFTSAVVGADVVVEAHLTGAQTRLLRSGVYDVFVYDDPTQARGLRVLDGELRVARAVTQL
jgi:hypothetical protein